jgi:uncharacterized protein YlxW (UPF0749 family)
MEFNKFTKAQIKRTAMNVWPMVNKRNKLQEKIEEMQNEINALQVSIDANEAAIKNLTGYSTEDLVVRTVVDTGKVDKKGQPIKITKYDLKYPETVVPPVEVEHDGEHTLLNENGEEVLMTEDVFNPDENVNSNNPNMI